MNSAELRQRATPGLTPGYHEEWFLKLCDANAQRALWLRFVLHSSSNGFQDHAETWAVASSRRENREVTKVAVKQRFEVSAFHRGQGESVAIQDCTLEDGRTQGSVTGKGRTIRWDLRIDPGHPGSFQLVPEAMSRIGLVRGRHHTVGEDLRFTGVVEIDGERTEWKGAPGMMAHIQATRSKSSWIRGHCNSFVDEQGRAQPVVFEGISAKPAPVAKLVPAPPFSTFYFMYQGREYRFNSLLTSLFSRSKHSLTSWDFHAESGELAFKGQLRAEHRDFAGLTYEDTDGSLLYNASSQLSDLTLWVYRRGKLETTLKAPGCASFEIVSREKNPYVPSLI